MCECGVYGVWYESYFVFVKCNAYNCRVYVYVFVCVCDSIPILCAVCELHNIICELLVCVVEHSMCGAVSGMWGVCYCFYIVVYLFL